MMAVHADVLRTTKFYTECAAVADLPSREHISPDHDLNMDSSFTVSTNVTSELKFPEWHPLYKYTFYFHFTYLLYLITVYFSK